MSKRSNTEASIENDNNCNVIQRFRNPAVPIHDKKKCQSFESYDDLLKSSTKYFRSKHLITATKNRHRLKEMCQKILNDEKENSSSKVHTRHETISSEFSRAVFDSCLGLAKKRLKSLLQSGKLYQGRSGKRNTIIVSNSEKILLHIEKSKRPSFHLKFRIDQKSSLSEHLVLDESGKICHYKK